MVSKESLDRKNIQNINAESSKRIQKRLFSLGYKWADGYQNYVDVPDSMYFLIKGGKIQWNSNCAYELISESNLYSSEGKAITGFKPGRSYKYVGPDDNDSHNWFKGNFTTPQLLKRIDMRGNEYILIFVKSTVNIKYIEYHYWREVDPEETRESKKVSIKIKDNNIIDTHPIYYHDNILFDDLSREIAMSDGNRYKFYLSTDGGKVSIGEHSYPVLNGECLFVYDSRDIFHVESFENPKKEKSSSKMSKLEKLVRIYNNEMSCTGTNVNCGLGSDKKCPMSGYCSPMVPFKEVDIIDQIIENLPSGYTTQKEKSCKIMIEKSSCMDFGCNLCPFNKIWTYGIISVCPIHKIIDTDLGYKIPIAAKRWLKDNKPKELEGNWGRSTLSEVREGFIWPRPIERAHVEACWSLDTSELSNSAYESLRDGIRYLKTNARIDADVDEKSKYGSLESDQEIENNIYDIIKEVE